MDTGRAGNEIPQKTLLIFCFCGSSTSAGEAFLRNKENFFISRISRAKKI